MITEEYLTEKIIPHIEEKIKKGDNEIWDVINNLISRIEVLESNQKN